MARPGNPDSEQQSALSHLAVLVGLTLLALHRNTPHRVRCWGGREDGLSCSRYGSAVIRQHGLHKGLGLALIRIGECRPR